LSVILSSAEAADQGGGPVLHRRSIEQLAEHQPRARRRSAKCRTSLYRSLTIRAHLPCGRMNRRTRMDDSTSEWLTYEQAAERLHVSAAAVRARAMRGGGDGSREMTANRGC
jgi:hypothetical protein